MMDYGPATKLLTQKEAYMTEDVGVKQRLQLTKDRVWNIPNYKPILYITFIRYRYKHRTYGTGANWTW